MTRRAGLAIAGLLLLMLGLEVLGESRRRDAATYGQGGGEAVCFCVTETPTFQMVVSPTPFNTLTPTPTDGSSSTPLPTSTPTLSATPTKVPVLPSHTPDVTECPGYPIAAERKGFDYRYLDRNNSGIWQRIRVGPGTNYAIVGYLRPMLRKPVFWTFSGWESLSLDCRQWVFNAIGELVDSWTE